MNLCVFVVRTQLSLDIYFSFLSFGTHVTLQMVNDDMYLEGDLFYDAVGLFLMYDATNRDSFQAIESVYQVQSSLLLFHFL